MHLGVGYRLTCSDVNQLVEGFLRELHTQDAEINARIMDRLPETDRLQPVTHNGRPSKHAPDQNRQQD